jgi:hypothetical protein
MTFRFGKLEPARFVRHIDGLQPHLAACNLERLVSAAKIVKYLAIEDFETHGLRGSYDPSAGIDSSYVAFWHRYGESGKSQLQGGRHGLGKSTIASASKLRLFFGATVQSDDSYRHLLVQGQASLRPHKIQGKPDVYDAYGNWYNSVPKADPLPFIDDAATNFMHNFELHRGKSPGLSLVIPFPDDGSLRTR